MRYAKVLITRSENSILADSVATYEIPILQLIHGEENVAFDGEVDVSRQWPGDAANEYARLELRYGRVDGGGQTFISLVYGAGVPGQHRLADAIVAAHREARDNPIDPEIEKKKAAKREAPKVAIAYDNGPLGSELTDAQMNALDAPAANFSPTTGVNLVE